MRLRRVQAPDRHVAIASVFLAAAVILGGGGSPNPGTELMLQFCFVAAALAWLWVPARTGLPAPRSVAFWAIFALILMLPILQLIPVPAGLWSALDSQGDRSAALALVGRENAWQTLSHSPAQTVAALLALVPPLFAFFATASFDSRGRFWMVATITAMAVATAIFGALQLSLGRGAPYLYDETHRDVLTGFQANRNATSDVLLIGIAATVALLTPSIMRQRSGERGASGIAIIPERKGAAMALFALLVLLLFAIVMTASRTGIALLAVVLVAVGIMLRPVLKDMGRARYLPAAAAALVMAGIAAFSLFGGNPALEAVSERFVLSGDVSAEGRRELWQDARFATEAAWPLGVGLGGAQSAMIAAERLEVLDARLPNRVHNDYLELALEGGVPALLVLLAVIGLLAVTAWRTWQKRPEDRHFTVLGLVILAIAAAHSVVDYPLRSMALACLIGTGAGLLIATPKGVGLPSAVRSDSRAIHGNLT